MKRGKAAEVSRKRRRANIIIIGIIAGIAAGIAFGVYSYAQSPPRTAGFGALGSTHEHAAFRVFIDGQAIDFSQPKYQVRSPYIHFEDANGDLLHLHATKVDLGFLFESFKMKFTSNCLVMDDGTEYCSNGQKTLKFFVNGVENSMYDKYVLKEGDRILISYGSETPEQIREQIDIVDGLYVLNTFSP
ncbi:MAG: hypothetical protein QXU32_02700 [Nitrososphaerales archaeon]